MQRARRQIYEAALQKWGKDAQLLMLSEEIGELLQAVSKWQRKKGSADSVAEVIADVRIMLEQLELMTDGSSTVAAEVIQFNKLKRLEGILFNDDDEPLAPQYLYGRP
jgi:NTP pyrophosphatase (non-canonical NTP hydrolase)